MLGHEPVSNQPISSLREFTSTASPDVFIVGMHHIELCMVSLTALRFGGVLEE
jgi:hypothetical protein